MNHPNLSNEINANIAKTEMLGGVWVYPHGDHVNEDIKRQPVLPVGGILKVKTRNTVYTIEKTGDTEFLISGNVKFCPQPTKCQIHGSTWGGSMIRVGFIGREMHLEFSTEKYRQVTTSCIEEIVEVQK